MDWKTSTATGFYNKDENSYYVIGVDENDEHLRLTFQRDPQFIGKLEEFDTGLNIPTCPHCASLAAVFTLDSDKTNKLEIIGFDNIQNRIVGKFTVHLKRERLYETDDFDEELATYEGIFSVLYRETGLLD